MNLKVLLVDDEQPILDNLTGTTLFLQSIPQILWYETF